MMRTFVPYGAAADEVPAGWGVRRAVRLDFPGPAALAADPVHTERLRVYLTDLLRPYGLALDAAALAGAGHAYGEMAEVLIERAVPTGESVDLLVLAYSVPDIAPGRATTTRLSHVCPGTPMAFAVTDQGAAAPFTALRLIRAYAGRLPRALLLVVEQPSLPYDSGIPVDLPATSSGVALLLGPPTPGTPTTPLGRVTTGPASAAQARTALAKFAGPATGADPLAEPAAPAAVILGSALAAQAPPLPGAPRVRTAAPGRPTTGVWWELAAELSAPPAEPAPLIVADHDPLSGTLSVAAFAAATEEALAAAAAPGRA
ncbi:hypothetical protein [Actinacidiphila paucisporea]|uniref:4-hydroxymandelate oxidase n=1 Tax=Actinacidiphila paucisporea TaxID=310782 RepID=A0A1M7I317_9ACTN|nr:hypothetical protein [Actinacidiphila paucisporea]SHM35186.1 4-hydroxymandelate oxidase [Actinacidiphila paucisporea]